jgi:hypothetical protein
MAGGTAAAERTTTTKERVYREEASLCKRADVCIWTGLEWVNRGQGGMNARASKVG